MKTQVAEFEQTISPLCRTINAGAASTPSTASSATKSAVETLLGATVMTEARIDSEVRPIATALALPRPGVDNDFF